MSGRRLRVLHYAHQHGSGHVRHAATLIRADVADVTVATAHPDAARLLPTGTRIVPLPTDIVPGHGQPEGSPLHHTPVGPAIQARFDALHDAARAVRPDVCVVDVSAEAALFLRLAGYPVVHRRMHGDRTDPAHRLVYAEADALFAHYGEVLEDPAWQAEFGARTAHLGVPDADGRLGRTAAPARAGEAPRVVAVTGTGGGGVAAADLARAARSTPGARWHVIGPVRDAGGADLPENLELQGWVEDVPAVLAAADVVVVSAGHNAAVDAARSGRPVVLAPEERPFAEQRRFAEAVERAAGVPWRAWEDPEADWAGAVARALGDPAAADRLAAALLRPPGEHAAGWGALLERAAASAQ
ncbi:glycosyltransferase [Micrococcus sp. ACRRV]|uniref:glycosyltransferase n=1 Tax=Micrococcus sp. ACRRV TaxID=2918203 RepID=UPI001EF3C13B|nr:glycosyltransferase [Micrococcus sp. ACRRV]